MNKILLSLGLMMTICAQSAEAAVAGRFQFVAGEVKVAAADGKERVARKGDEVNEGESVMTASSASAQIKMTDDGLIVVRPDTKLRITTFLFHGKTDGSERSLISLLRGGFRAITGMIGRVNKDAYKIETPGATIGIRGTDHEPRFIPNPLPGQVAIAEPGTYDKVNSGAAVLSTAQGLVVINPNQAGFVPNIPNAAPAILATIPAFYKSATGKDEPKVVPQGGARLDDGESLPSAQASPEKEQDGSPGRSKVGAKNEPKAMSRDGARLKEGGDLPSLQASPDKGEAGTPATSKTGAMLAPAKAGVLATGGAVKGVAEPTAVTGTSAGTTLMPLKSATAVAPVSTDTLKQPTLNMLSPTAATAPISTDVPLTILKQPLNTLSPTPTAVTPLAPAISPTTKSLSTVISPIIAPTTTLVAPAPITTTPLAPVIAPTSRIAPATIAPIIAPTTTPLAPAPTTLVPLAPVIAPTSKIVPMTISPIVAPTLTPVAPAPITTAPLAPVIAPIVTIVPTTTIQTIVPITTVAPTATIIQPIKTISPITTFSDRRLKTNIRRVGTHPFGFGIYEFDYIWGEHATGVMADEVKLVMPEAVLRDASGYDKVDYSKLN